MKISKVIEKLQAIMQEWGDLDVHIDGTGKVEEVIEDDWYCWGVDCDGTECEVLVPVALIS